VNLARVVHFADALQLLAQDCDLLFHLKTILGVLIITAATGHEVRARGFHSMLRLRNNFNRLCSNQVRSFLFGLNARDLAWNQKRREDNLARTSFFRRQTRQRIAAINPLIRGHFDYDKT
jgi:hypothetical protein